MTIFLRRLGFALGSRVATLPVTAVATALTTYFVVQYVGAGTFGFVSLLGTLFLLIPFADLGLGAAVINAVAVRDQGPDQVRAARDATFRATIALVLAGTVVILVAGTLSLLNLWPTLLNLPPSLSSEGNAAAFAVFAVFGASLPFGLGQRLLVAAHKTHHANLILGVGPIVALCSSLLLIVLGAPAMALAVSTPLGILISAVGASALGLRQLGWTLPLLYAARLPSRIGQVPLLKTALPVFAITVGAPLAMQSHRLILAYTGSGSDLTDYSLGAQFYAPALSIVTTGAMSLWPQFSEKLEERRKNWLLSLFTIGGVGLLGALALGILLPPVASLVTAGLVTVPLLLGWSFGVLLLAMALHQPSAMLLTQPTDLRFQAICLAGLAAVSIPIGLLLVPLLGPSGPVLATAGAVLVTCLLPGIVRALYRMRVDDGAKLNVE